MKKILLIRHGMTQGNAEKRYIGRTDEPLCPAGLAEAKALVAAKTLPPVGVIISSPLLRCRQTAETLFPGQEFRIADDLAECDFGHFEGRTASDLAVDAEYRQWIDSGCKEPIPGGEDVTAFLGRSADAFSRELLALPENSAAAFVIHGGVIMAILERYARPKHSYYEYHLGNCKYYVCLWKDGSLEITEWPA
ncbi:MAG: histidine phosphatase family protein [Clostridiales Family XIII bacterium]|jgi:alpha-ribazole phosphatase|nr:histidine phosphatase family protein [Clostridiales Family XIII bacterium]